MVAQFLTNYAQNDRWLPGTIVQFVTLASAHLAHTTVAGDVMVGLVAAAAYVHAAAAQRVAPHVLHSGHRTA